MGYIKVKTLLDGRTISESKTTTCKNQPNPVWNEVITVDFPENRAGGAMPQLLLEIKDDCLGPDRTVGRIGPIEHADVVALVRSEQQLCMVPNQDEGGFGKRKLGESTVTLQLVAPAFEHEAARLHGLWSAVEEAGRRDRAGWVRAPAGSGLCFIEAGLPFLTAATALEHAAYFLDILVRQCGGVARMMGDLGLVLVSPVLSPLLDEAEQRLIATVDSLLELHDVVYRIHVRIARDGKATRRPNGTEQRAREEAETAVAAIKELKTRMLATIGELREVFFRYKDIKGALSDAQTSVDDLRSRLLNGETTRRSGRFAGAVQALTLSSNVCGEPPSRVTSSGSGAHARSADADVHDGGSSSGDS
eukprot:NODE_1496_length_1126_cov_267.829132.p2 GENE.NODE_1496_length_1126_cov_267.829132~~NODE_1496_length_1126_cov_267.829132.p2  ORF type:complete len:362 (-),score=122.16 NODE_1496_length_1126_cov_267.829132:23-1108(-)